MSDKKIPLVEVFRAPQGEGYNAGRDAIFVRTAGCTLSCVFAEGAYCDTPYQKAHLKPTLDELFDEIIPDLIEMPDPSGTDGYQERLERPMLVVTGGEPTMQPLFDDLVMAGVGAGFYVAVETNGTRMRDGLMAADHVTVSPKDSIGQGSPFPLHNQNPQDPTPHPEVLKYMAGLGSLRGEYRFVITGPDDPAPPCYPGRRHYVSPAVIADGTGQEWRTGFPGFVPGAVERCLEIIQADPRWRISVQTHKLLGVR